MLPPFELQYPEYGWSQFLVDASLYYVIFNAVFCVAYVAYRIIRYVAFERKQEGYLLTLKGKRRQNHNNGNDTWSQFLFGFDTKSPSTKEFVFEMMWTTSRQAKLREDQGEEINPEWQRTARMHLHIANNFDNYLNASLAKGYLKPA